MSILVFTGAGASADSGIQTFRGSNGLWNNHKIDEVCNSKTFYQNADKVHRFYSDMREEIFAQDSFGRFVQPHEIHSVIKHWQDDFGAKVFTTNIDDLHEQEGTVTTHLHGHLDYMRCLDCNHIWCVNGKRTEWQKTSCPKCSSKEIKPHVIFFGEPSSAYSEVDEELTKLTEKDIVVVIGCSNTVINFDAILSNLPSTNIWCNIDGLKTHPMFPSFFQYEFIGKAIDIADDLDYFVRKKIYEL